MELNKIYYGDSLDVIKTFPDESVDMVITSPPYWNLRDYGVEGQLGQEYTFDEYIDKLCIIFDEVKRVLKNDGTCWVNLSDTYAGSGKGAWKNKLSQKEVYVPDKRPCMNENVSSKSLCCIPDRFKIEMINRGWICRNEIIWHKPNVMPSSVKDRFTVDFEKLFFFTKSKKYYFETQYEPYTSHMNRWGGINLKADNISECDNETGHTTYRKRSLRPNEQGRNKRAVWTISTKPFKEAHFATYPLELIEVPIKAGCPEFICNKCGKPREKIEQYTGNNILKGGVGSIKYENSGLNLSKTSTLLTKTMKEKQFIGYSDCGCNEGFSNGIVLDPFMGSGTTAVVAKKLNRNFIGIELNSKYIEIANKRINDDK